MLPPQMAGWLRLPVGRGGVNCFGSLNERLNEAFVCLEAGALRGAAIMVWAGAIAVMHEAAERHGLKEFERLARSINAKAHTLDRTEDLQYYDDDLFLATFEKAGMISKTQRGILLVQLKRRNAYAHPSGVAPSEEEVRALISELVQIVFNQGGANLGPNVAAEAPD
jgi:hypothetical protein